MSFCIFYAHWVHILWEQRYGSALSFFVFPRVFFLCSVFVSPKYFIPNFIAFLVFPCIFCFPGPFSPSFFSFFLFYSISFFKTLFFALYPVLSSCNLSLSSPHSQLFFSVTFLLIYSILSLAVFPVFLLCDPTDQWP